MKYISMAAMMLALAACGAAGLGESCSTAGSTDGCQDGLVCTNSNNSAVCSQLCETDSDCSNGQNCNGISGSNLKSCQ